MPTPPPADDSTDPARGGDPGPRRRFGSGPAPAEASSGATSGGAEGPGGAARQRSGPPGGERGSRSTGGPKGPRARTGAKPGGTDRGAGRGQKGRARTTRGADRSGARPSPRPSQHPPPGPAIPDEVTGAELDKDVREELRTLSREAAEIVSRHLVMTARLLDEDPSAASEHARAAVARGGRLSVVREAAGIAAYRAGDYADALRQLRAARRISGSDAYWPMMADCERGLGRSDRALAMAGGPEVRGLDRAGRAEMRIVAAGARRDLGQLDAALVTLQCAELRSADRTPWSARIKYAYGDALLAAGRSEEARTWFERAEQADVHEETEAAERLAELDGLVWTDLAEPDADEPADD